MRGRAVCCVLGEGRGIRRGCRESVKERKRDRGVEECRKVRKQKGRKEIKRRGWKNEELTKE